MTRIFLAVIFVLSIYIAEAQHPTDYSTIKPPIDTAAFFNWPSLSDWADISNDGQYILYFINNIPKGGCTTVVQGLINNRKTELTDIQNVRFTKDSRHLVFMHGDSLCLYTLANSAREYIPHVNFFELCMLDGNEWIVYQLNTIDHKLIFRNLADGVQMEYKDVGDHILSTNGKIMVLQSVSDSNNDNYTSLMWVNLSTNDMKAIWKGRSAANLILSSDATQLAFISDGSGSNKKDIWLYRSGGQNAYKLNASFPQEMEIESIDNFSEDGNKLFLQLKQRNLRKEMQSLVPLNIWSYTDPKLQTQQLAELKYSGNFTFLFVVDLNNPSHIQRLQQENETIRGRTNEYVLVRYCQGEGTENYWNSIAHEKTFLVNVNSGMRSQIPLKRSSFSPNEKFIVGNSNKLAGSAFGTDVYTYEIATGITRNITEKLSAPFVEESVAIDFKDSKGLSIAGWLPGDSALLIYDPYDIWKVDPTNIKSPINLTNGRKIDLQFRFANPDYLLKGEAVRPKNKILLKAFNTSTKQSGFYELSPGENNQIRLLSFGNFVIDELVKDEYSVSAFFLKADSSNVYIVKREQTGKSPNLFSTADFIKFTPVSQIYPESAVNWMTSELINFKTSDGVPTQAVLYKPENFDPSKRYPLIVHYYIQKSDGLNVYQHPVLENGGELDIAWFVSHEYLVCITDIHFKIEKGGESVKEAVEGITNHLSSRSYVDRAHIGIQGHSFGGYETNYLITHSNLFAAAVSSCGVSDFISDYGNVWGGGASRQELWETRYGACMGATPWDKPEVYINNSPIFYIGKVKMPVLLMANRNDMNVHFEQGLEFFTGLRRAGKRAWMLEYDNGGHGVFGEEYKDYLLRMAQFFDHYLKDSPAPKWMMQGIPAKDKGYDGGMELVIEKDKNGKWVTPGPGLLRDDLLKKR